jgi:hypothetical protein
VNVGNRCRRKEVLHQRKTLHVPNSTTTVAPMARKLLALDTAVLACKKCPVASIKGGSNISGRNVHLLCPRNFLFSKRQRRLGAPCPGFPTECGGVDKLHAAFLNESRTRGCCLVPLTGNPGQAVFWLKWDTALNLSALHLARTPCHKQVRGSGSPSLSGIYRPLGMAG